MVNVTRENFVEASDDFLKHLATASYVAIDEEMTGISIPGEKRAPKDDTPEQRYQRLKAVPERYSIISVGVSLFHKNPNFQEPQQRLQEGEELDVNNGNEDEEITSEPEYIARPYNFYTFPSPSRQSRDITLSPAAIQFLNEHGMDFAMWTKTGVGYVHARQAKEIIARMQKKLDEQEAAKNDGTPSKPTSSNSSNTNTTPSSEKKIVLTRPQDIEFVGRVVAQVREWLDNSSNAAPLNPDGLRPSELALPPCNAFLRRALYETISEGYPSLVLEKGEGVQRSSIIVHRLSEEEKKEREKAKRLKDIHELKMTIGFYRVFQAISDAARGEYDPNVDDKGNVNYLLPQITSTDSAKEEDYTSNGLKKEGIPIIVHNGLMDLLFLMTHFCDSMLPDTWVKAKALVHGFFPKIFDTKCLAEEYSDVSYNSSTLIDMFSYWRTKDRYRRVQLAPEFKDRYDIAPGTNGNTSTSEKASGAHEAAFDAYMTGSLYYYISRSIFGKYSDRHQETVCVESFHKIDDPAFGMNKLLCWGTVYNLDLNSSDSDQYKRGLHPRFIFRISGIDSAVKDRDIRAALERLYFDILWVDDVTFLIAAKGEFFMPENCTLETDFPIYYRMARTIQDKLESRFGSDRVTTLEQYLEEGDQRTTKRKRGIIDSLVSVVTNYFGGSGGSKRRRLEE